jgi:hypothetical protein
MEPFSLFKKKEGFRAAALLLSNVVVNLNPTITAL